MSRLVPALSALFGAVAGVAGTLFLTQPPPTVSEAEIRALIAETVDTAFLARQPAAEERAPQSAALSPETLNPLIEDYLMSDPTILQRLSIALETRLIAEERVASATAIAAIHDLLYETDDHVVLGNPDGDVTLIEMFDYNCSYCRQALPDLATLLAEDPGLRVILKEFPILSEASADAARVSVLVARSDADYWAFHQALFSARGQVTRDLALETAVALGLARVPLELEMGDQSVSLTLARSYQIADALNIGGTPTYILGDEIIPGAVGIEALRERIANMRACGSTRCEG